MDKVSAAAIVQELQARSAISPSHAQDAHAVRAAIGCSSVCFDAALVKLTDLGLVGTVMSHLYLKTSDPEVLGMLE